MTLEGDKSFVDKSVNDLSEAAEQASAIPIEDACLDPNMTNLTAPAPVDEESADGAGKSGKDDTDGADQECIFTNEEEGWNLGENDVTPEADEENSDRTDESGAGDWKEQGEESSNPTESHGQQPRTMTGRMPRQWLIDRCDGRSKSGDPESRPPNRLCWPPLPLKWYPDMLEQNCMCETVGRFGCVDPTDGRKRRVLLWTCLVCNIVGFFFLLLSSFSIAKNNFGILWHFSFTNVWLESSSFTTPTLYAVGLRAVALDELVTRTEDRIIPFDSFCEIFDEEREIPCLFQSRSYQTLFVETHYKGSTSVGDCSSCQDISKRIVPSLFLSMLGYIPNFTTDVLRMYENYDVNCQKFFASIFSWISFATAIYTWANYRRNCFSYVDYRAPICADGILEHITGSDVSGEMRLKYSSGLGEVCLALASLLKVVDIICNIVIPTPSITRSHAEQVEYEQKYGPGHGTEDVVEGSACAGDTTEGTHE